MLDLTRVTLAITIILWLTPGDSAFAQAAGETSCKDGSKVSASVEGGACTTVKGVGVSCEANNGKDKASSFCGEAQCTSTGTGKCSMLAIGTPPPKPGVRTGIVSAPAGIKPATDPNSKVKGNLVAPSGLLNDRGATIGMPSSAAPKAGVKTDVLAPAQGGFTPAIAPQR